MLKGQNIQYHSNPSLCPDQYCKEAEVDQFCEDIQDLVEQKRKKKRDIVFIVRDWNAKVRSQELPGITAKFGLGA